MKGKVLNFIENVLTIELKNDANYKEGEPVEIKKIRTTFREELHALLWVLLAWVIDNEYQKKLPGNWFRIGEARTTAIEKLYTLVRFQAEWVDVDYDRDGMQRIRARSTSREKCTEEQLSEIYEKTYQYFADNLDMTGFNIQHQQARESRGKYF